MYSVHFPSGFSPQKCTDPKVHPTKPASESSSGRTVSSWLRVPAKKNNQKSAVRGGKTCLVGFEMVYTIK